MDSVTIDISHTNKRQIEWNVASASISGTIQWEGQAAKSITGTIAYRETLNNRFFYDWTYNSADRPASAVAGVINLTDGTTSVSIPVLFTTTGHLLEADKVLEDVGGVRKLKTYVRGTTTELLPPKTAKQTDGSDLTNPATQRLAGYREE